MTDDHEHRHDHDHEHPHDHAHLSYEEAIADFRARKDAYYRDDSDSPLLPEDRPNFGGIAYFPPDQRYRIDGLTLEAPATDEDINLQIPTSDGQLRPARRVGQLRFRLDDRELSLHGYGLPGMHGGQLFVPFLDATSGAETYEAGRYLDLEAEQDGTYTLDFNLAYHPTCVFSPYYSCPLTPEENRLPLRVEAGERLTPGIGAH